MQLGIMAIAGVNAAVSEAAAASPMIILLIIGGLLAYCEQRSHGAIAVGKRNVRPFAGFPRAVSQHDMPQVDMSRGVTLELRADNRT
jgi:hypothetical protein